MNDEPVSKTIELVQSQIQEDEKALAEKKRMVNSLCGLIGRDPVYANTDPINSSVGIRSDEFYGKPLAKVVRTILEKRAASGLFAISLDDLYTSMLQGGFLFEAKNDGTAKRALSISLSKNPIFHRVPNSGNIGLKDWYPDAKTRSTKDDKAQEKSEQTEQQQTEDKDGMGPYPNDFAEKKPKIAYRFLIKPGKSFVLKKDGVKTLYKSGEEFVSAKNWAAEKPEIIELIEEIPIVTEKAK